VSDVWLLLQLVFGFAVVLAPGLVVARAVGVTRVSAAVAWALFLVFVALAVTFLLSASLTLTLVLVLLAGLCALPFAIRRGTRVHGVRGWRLSALVGAALGILMWRFSGTIGGDGFFHLARIQKLLAFDDL
jgi:hypothetical protein